MDKEKIGKFIASCRKEKDWTQEELADILFVDRATISKWERGIYIPSNEILLKLQELFNVSINEILFGEKRNNRNTEKIDTVPINIMNDANRKRKKILIISISIIFFLIISFFIYYFFSNYNSIKVYRISGSNDEFFINEGIMIVSPEKSYIKIGNINKEKNIDIQEVKLYYIKNNEEHIIIEGGEDHINSLLETEFSYVNSFQYKDINAIINNLYLKITDTENQDYILKLKLNKDFSNNKLFNFRNLDSISLDDNTGVSSFSVPDYVIQNFKLDNSQRRYYRESKNNNCSLKEEYFYEVDIYSLVSSCGEYDEIFSYSNYDKYLNYYMMNGEETIDNYTYDYENNKCQFKVCNIEQINKFKEKYLDVVFGI